jgi:hypothetical protein
MNKRAKAVSIIGLIAILVGLFIKYAPDYLAIMKPAPPGIHGLYSSDDRDAIYKTNLHKDTLLHELDKEGLVIKSGRLHDYDPPWDSLRYLIDNITCDTQRIEPYIEFRKDRANGLTTFKILWINATPNLSYDTAVYWTLTRKYYNCFDAILKRHKVNSK